MNAIQKIKAKVSRYPDVRYSESADEIEVHPRDQSGFTVGLRITPSGFTVHFEGWLARGVHVRERSTRLLCVWALAEVPAGHRFPRRDRNQVGS
jgi:hypothetical protein